MTTDFRALISRMLDELNRYHPLDAEGKALIARARAALAEPEPLADAGKVETLRELALKELDAWVEERNGLGESIICDGLRVRLIKAALAEPEPPVDGEVAELVAWLCDEADEYDCIQQAPDVVCKLRRAADLLERLAEPGPPAIVPIPVSERLPGPQDCNDKGECWWFSPEVPSDLQADLWGLCANRNEEDTHWIPAHVLPVPNTTPDTP